jgi:hypothetical protein
VIPWRLIAATLAVSGAMVLLGAIILLADRSVYLRTGLHAIMPPFERDPHTASTLMASASPRYVLVDSSGFSSAREYAAPACALPDSGWRLAFADGRGLLQLYEREAARRPPEADTSK